VHTLQNLHNVLQWKKRPSDQYMLGAYFSNCIEEHAGGAGDASGIRRLEESCGPFHVAWPV
jgi:hypothetical protein